MKQLGESMTETEAQVGGSQTSVARILIVEDEGDVRDALKAQLTLEGYEVVEARSGSDALELLEQQAF